MDCLKATIHVNGRKVKVLIDNGAEVNVISRRFASEAGIAIRNGHRLNMIVAIREKIGFLGVADNVDVDIGGIIHAVPFFVVEGNDHSVILGRLYSRRARISINDTAEGTCEVTVYSEKGDIMVSLQSSPAESSRNRKERDVFNLSLKAEADTRPGKCPPPE